MTQHDKSNYNQGKETKTSHELESEIGQTRNAITGDIQALNDKFTPAHMKAQAKEAMSGVKDAAVEQAAEIKDAVVDKAIEVKDAVVDKAVEMTDAAAEKMVVAKDAMVETMQDVGEQAMRAGSATWRFTKANAVPLALLGVGASWLVANNRRSLSGAAVSYDDDDAWDDVTEPRMGVASARARRRTASEHREPVRTQNARANKSASMNKPSTTSRVSARTRGMLDEAADSADRAEHKIADGAARSARYVQDKFQQARAATGDFATANPLVVAMATLFAGVGIGILLPSTDREDKLLAPSRAKFQHLIGDVRDAASDVAQVATDTASKSLQAMT